MVKCSYPAELQVTTEAVTHASGLLIAVNSVQVDQKDFNQGNADSTSRGAGLALWSSILTQQSTRLQQKQLHTPMAFDRCQLCSSRPKSPRHNKPRRRTRAVVKQSHPPEAPGYNRSSCTRQWLVVAVNSVQVDQKAATRATLTQQAAAQDSRCGQVFLPSRAPGYNRSSYTRQWLVDRCQLCSSRPKRLQPGQR